MVQTRGQTRNGAPAPSAIEPFSTAIVNNTINNPSRSRRRRRPGRQQRATEPAAIYSQPSDENGQPAHQPPTHQDERPGTSNDVHGDDILALPRAPRIAPTFMGACQAEQDILRNIVASITGLDLHNLVLAFPVFRQQLRVGNAPRPLACQDHPVVPMLKHQDPTNHRRLAFQPVPPLQPSACTTPATSTIPLKRCEGHNLGYSGQDGAPDHGPEFWVCQHCVQKAWEAYSMFVKSRGVDLCKRCSQGHRRSNAPPIRPPGYPRQCVCIWNDKVWLCTTCRMAKSMEDRRNALDWIQSQLNFVPMHVPGQGAHPKDYIDPESRDGESYCPCGLDVQGKIRSYDNIFDPTAAPDFRPLVRLCIYCRQERFLTDTRLD